MTDKTTIGDATFILGDCLNILPELPEKSINCCVTSPPYFGLRDYGHNDQIGLEDHPDKYVEKLVNVFREVKRVLRDDGTLWLNLGDTYSGNNLKNRKGNHGYKDKRTNRIERLRSLKIESLRCKNLIGIPWRVAFALQADGWYLRQDIIWHKPNPMPESVRDRCTKSHEYIFLLSKKSKYYYDYKAIEEPAKWERWGNQTENKKHTGAASYLGGGKLEDLPIKNTKNKRSVWTIPTKPFTGAHFAVFPPDLIEPCVLAGCPKGGVVLDPFGGSGTSALVSYKNNRQSIYCELNKDYFDIAVARYRRETAQLRLEDIETG